MQTAMGRNTPSAYAPAVHKVSERLQLNKHLQRSLPPVSIFHRYASPLIQSSFRFIVVFAILNYESILILYVKIFQQIFFAFRFIIAVVHHAHGNHRRNRKDTGIRK